VTEAALPETVALPQRRCAPVPGDADQKAGATCGRVPAFANSIEDARAPRHDQIAPPTPRAPGLTAGALLSYTDMLPTTQRGRPRPPANNDEVSP
jgi:hypothetical protein